MNNNTREPNDISTTEEVLTNQQKDYVSFSTKEQTQEEIDTAQQEAYYWHVLQEFYAMTKVFGAKQVTEDLKKIKESIEDIKEEPRIITL